MNNLTELQKDIVNNIGVEYDPLKISIIDSIKFLLDILNEKKLFKILEKHKKIGNVSDIDSYIIDKLSNPYYLDLVYIQQTYFDNLVLGVYFVLNNPFLYSTYQLKAFHNNLDTISLIPSIIKNCLQKTYDTPHLKKFFNEFLFKRWLDSFNFKKISFEKYVEIVGDNIDNNKFYNMYSKVWSIFELIVHETKTIIEDFHAKYKGLNHIPGCTNISKEFYEYCVETNVGMPFGKKIKLENVLQWGIKEFQKVKGMMKDNILKLEPQLEGKDFFQMIEYIQSSKKYKYNSKEEFIKDHRENIKKYRDFFVEEKKFPLLHEPMLVDFDEEKMAGGYWFLDTFYLNTNRWFDTNNFDTPALVLHETIPGHHMQLSYEIHNNKIDSLILWFQVYTNGFTEGWGLFSEKLGHDLDDFKYLGILSFHMMRTLRIIADISIHLYGIEPEELIQFFKNHLPMSEETIKAEVYRYVSLPGQALCYKIGDEILKRLFLQKFNRNNNLIEDDSIELYIKLIKEGTMPLELVAKKYNIDTKF